MKKQIENESAMKQFGEEIGRRLKGSEVFELVGDVGSGKTTFAKGLARGLEVTDDVQSPSFTINRTYQARDGLTFDHYDFYRLHEAGIMSYELSESINDPHTITLIEWADTVSDVLPATRTKMTFSYQPSGEGRIVEVEELTA